MGIFKLKLENFLYEIEVNLSWFVAGFSSSQVHGGHSSWLVTQSYGGGGAWRNHCELRPHKLALPPRWRIGAGASLDNLHDVVVGHGELQAWRRGVEQERCAEHARHSWRIRGVPGDPRRCLGRRWVEDGRNDLTGVMVVWFSRLVGGGSLGGVRFRGERESGKGKEKKERKDREERERKGKKNCFGFFFDFGSG